MPRSLIASLVVGLILTLFTMPGPRHGFESAVQSLTHWSYYPNRDMRNTVGVPAQKIVNRGPDSSSVPTIGRELPLDRDVAAERLHSPFPSNEASIAKGDSVFHKFCVPCHGMAMAGDGPVAANFMPPPDLLGQQTRNRKDGYIYSYIRNGGVIMPSYGFQVSAEEAWNVIHYLRHMQQTSPR
ncbi:MAG: cytochrome c [Candidatus Eisenbacteria bacterium]|uniref:Cytochrome c n=1 Tax=Eiseniibacteriota bacterium TaxID=2212470 RepID=A0A9D6L9P3_UNCEI|nr:cytochrome c [Candidatus Eisenbacteria bacterium]MBI3540180.1 cytochrome c [Candidatus Eisenbacteria bacterium]